MNEGADQESRGSDELLKLKLQDLGDPEPVASTTPPPAQ
jgi:hypothetical protein